MSVVFVPERLRENIQINQNIIQQIKREHKENMGTADKKADKQKTGGGPRGPDLTPAEELALQQNAHCPVSEGIPVGSGHFISVNVISLELVSDQRDIDEGRIFDEDTVSDYSTGGELLDENDQLIRCIVDYQQKGRASDCVQYQQILHRNLVYLATISDSTPSTPSAVIVTFPDTVAEAAVVNSAIKPEVNHPMSPEEKRNDRVL